MAESETGFKVLLIIIVLATLVVVFLVIVARRQIERFKQRSKYRPYTPVGTGAPKALKREINRRLDVVEKITFEPLHMASNGDPVYPKVSESTILRMRAVDELKNLDNDLEQVGSAGRRNPGKNIRTYLIGLLNTTLWGSPNRLVHEFCDLYERARHSPEEFTEEDLARYRSLMMRITEIVSGPKYGGEGGIPPGKWNSPGNGQIKTTAAVKRLNAVYEDGKISRTMTRY